MIRYQSLLLKNILSKGFPLYSTSVTAKKKTQSTLFQRLSEEFTAAKPIISKLKKYDQINVNFNEWKSRIDIMMQYHFSDVECFQMISEYPSLLEIPLSTFEGSIQQWHYANLGLDNCKTVLMKQPVLLEIHPDDIRKRMPQLRVYFGSVNSITDLLSLSPNVMYDNWNSVVVRIHYLLKERQFKAGEIAQSATLSRSLDFMKFRFDLLEKCGIYKQSDTPIHKVNKFDRSGHVNPSLKSILLTNTKKFVTLAKISEEEYDVYLNLYMANEDDGSDSESDNEF